MHAFAGLTWLRDLAIAVMGGGHPLQHPLLAQYAAQYHSDVPAKWSFEANARTPVAILQRLGVNVFEAWEFDAWVLETLLYVFVLPSFVFVKRPLPSITAGKRA